MKALYLILFALLLSLYTCEECYKIEPEKAANCNDNKVDDGYCCYVSSKTKHKKNGSVHEDYSCVALTKEQYNKINEMIDNGKKAAEQGDWEVSSYKIDCGSNYIIYSLLSLILLFL